LAETVSQNRLQTAKGKLKRRFFERFFDYLSGYEAVLKAVLPASAVKAFQLFSRCRSY
jgi:hypothetical protein